jgi:hypothetical protein
MKTFKRTALTALASLVAVAGFMMAPSPASAGWDDCPDESGYLCFWVNLGWEGTPGKLSGTNAYWSSFSKSQCGSGTWDNCASSLRNEGRSCEAVVYRDPNFRGPSWVINRDTGVYDLRQWSMEPGRNWDNEISSNSWWCG